MLNLDTCFIIAESGTCHADHNHIRKFGRALEYVHAAKKAGANAIKFQMFDDPTKETMFCWIDGDENRNHRWHESRMGLDQWHLIKQECDRYGIIFLASVFENETIKWLIDLNVVATKVASRAAPYLGHFRFAPKPLLVSNGMTEVTDRDDIIILECEANYPSTLKWSGNFPGFSDHSGGTSMAIDAMNRGCKLIEVHFYTDPSHAGPDLPASLSLPELEMICDNKNALPDLPVSQHQA